MRVVYVFKCICLPGPTLTLCVAVRRVLPLFFMGFRIKAAMHGTGSMYQYPDGCRLCNLILAKLEIVVTLLTNPKKAADLAVTHASLCQPGHRLAASCCIVQMNFLPTTVHCFRDAAVVS